MNRKLNLLAGLAALIALCACNLPGQAAPHTWIDAPLDGSVLPAGAKVDVISHANDLSGITHVELSVNGAVLRTDAAPNGQVYVLMDQPWTPSGPGAYQVRVRAETGGGQWSGYAVVNVTVEGSPTNTLTLIQSASPTPLVSATVTPTPAALTFTLDKNAFCRKGPALSFADITAIPSGETVSVQGRSEDGAWLFVLWEKYNVKCWIGAATGKASGALQGVPVLVSPPTPTPTSAPSATSNPKP